MKDWSWIVVTIEPNDGTKHTFVAECHVVDNTVGVVEQQGAVIVLLSHVPIIRGKVTNHPFHARLADVAVIATLSAIAGLFVIQIFVEHLTAQASKPTTDVVPEVLAFVTPATRLAGEIGENEPCWPLNNVYIKCL